MVRALLAGTKTQTRRAVKPQFERGPVDVVDGVPYWDAPTNYGGEVQMNTTRGKPCPHGVPGDQLWGREGAWFYGQWFATGEKRKNGDARWSFKQFSQQVCFDNPGYDAIAHWGGKAGWAKFPGIHMPRWASRIQLELTDVRVERLQDISEDDALAEGIEAMRCRDCHLAAYGLPGWGHDELNPTAKGAYRYLWESINGPGSWDADPFVWVIEFRRIQLRGRDAEPARDVTARNAEGTPASSAPNERVNDAAD